jgi:serine/threonine-protein phosphatase 2A regulatory subunit B''
VSQPPRDDQVLQQKLREDARAVFLQRRGSELMDNEELTKLWTILEEKHTPPDLGTDEQMISYTAFLDIKDQVSDKCKPFFTAEVFTKLLRDDPYGRFSPHKLGDSTQTRCMCVGRSSLLAGSLFLNCFHT